MTKRMCYSFEPSGHKFEPLNIMEEGDGFFFVLSLYCPRCSRVVVTAPEHNYEGWDFENLPAASKVDAMAGGLIIRKEN